MHLPSNNFKAIKKTKKQQAQPKSIQSPLYMKLNKCLVISGPAINSAKAALDLTDHGDSVPFNK